MSDSGLKAEILAGELAVSRRNFFRRVKQLTGLTPNEYLREVRLQAARRMLETKKHTSVKAVAFAAGYHKVKHFSTIFRQRFGRPPSDYLL
ncbi:MAG: helix-turn-helix domain-containing protein [Saprospiraceae bacterium]